MSYSFLIHGVAPAPEFLRDKGVSYKPIRIKQVRAWIAWRGRPSRGVLFSEDDGATRIKLPVCASPDDVSLAQELAAGWATIHGLPIDVEEDPPGVKWVESTAPTAPPGMPPGEPGQYFTPAQLLAWPTTWHDYQNTSIWASWDPEVDEEAADRAFRLLSGPVRTTAVGKMFLARALQRPSGFLAGLKRLLGQRPSVESDSKALVAALCDAQDPRWLKTPVRPWFGSDSLPAGRVELRNLLPPSSLLGEPFLDVVIPGGASGPKSVFTVFIPDEPQLMPSAHYVAIRESVAEWVCVPFAVFQREMSDFVRPLDESTWVVESPSPTEWKAVFGRMRPEGVGHVPHEEDFLEAAQEIGRRGSPSQGQSDEENTLINSVRALMKAGSFDEGVRVSAKLVCAAPDSAQGWYWRSRVAHYAKDVPLRMEAMRMSIALPEFNRALLGGKYAEFAHFLFELGQVDEARRFVDLALVIGPDDWSMRADVMELKSTLAEGTK